MKSLRNILLSTATAAGLFALAAQPAAAGTVPAVGTGYKHVLLISVDGMHAIDLTRWIQSNPTSTLAKLSHRGVIYSNALTTGPSDSFPGMIAQVTGATPKSAGLFYDDSFDRTMWAAGSNCQGAPGAEIQNFESIDWNLNDVTGGGTLGDPMSQINPANLNLAMVNGACTPLYPHNYLHVNTIFEVIKNAGMLTAWSDKHPAYEVLGGPSGSGITDLYTPEINSQMFLAGAPVGADNTKSYAAVRAYDSIKVKAVINWIDGWNSTHTAKPGTPAIFGMNFQAVSVGQKLAKSGYGDTPGMLGGYTDGNATPGAALALQLAFVDASLGKMKNELIKQGLDSSTLIIVSAKHGQSPIDKSARVAIDDSPYANMPGHAFHIADDASLIWMDPAMQKTQYAAAKAWLVANSAALGIAQVLDRPSLTALYKDPFNDARTPDFIAVVNHGVVYTGGSKLSEHGGFAADDRNVALLLSAPDLGARIVETAAQTTQIAPTILRALGLNPTDLQGVVLENTKVLSR